MGRPKLYAFGRRTYRRPLRAVVLNGARVPHAARFLGAVRLTGHDRSIAESREKYNTEQPIWNLPLDRPSDPLTCHQWPKPCPEYPAFIARSME